MQYTVQKFGMKTCNSSYKTNICFKKLQTLISLQWYFYNSLFILVYICQCSWDRTFTFSLVFDSRIFQYRVYCGLNECKCSGPLAAKKCRVITTQHCSTAEVFVLICCVCFLTKFQVAHHREASQLVLLQETIIEVVWFVRKCLCKFGPVLFPDDSLFSFFLNKLTGTFTFKKLRHEICSVHSQFLPFLLVGSDPRVNLLEFSFLGRISTVLNENSLLYKYISLGRTIEVGDSDDQSVKCV